LSENRRGIFLTHTVELKFAPLVTLVQRYVSAKLIVFCPLYFEKIGGTRRSDRRTDGDSATINAADREGHISIVSRDSLHSFIPLTMV